MDINTVNEIVLNISTIINYQHSLKITPRKKVDKILYKMWSKNLERKSGRIYNDRFEKSKFSFQNIFDSYQHYF